MTRFALTLLLGLTHIGQVAPDGTEPQVDYPGELWMRNVGSRLDGAGMCVFTSIEMSAIWCGLDEFRGFRDWCAQHYPGGGYPQKVDTLIQAYCTAKRIRKPDYIQYEGSDLELARRALRSGRMVCWTLYRSPRYPGLIYHMTNGIHADDAWMALLDNNQIRGEPIPPREWDKPDAMEARLKLHGRVWIFVWLRHGPTPIPKN
jgi:hypothetical protein